MYSDRINQLCDRYSQDWIGIRRELHKHPEVANNEFKTSEILKSYLSKFDLEISEICKTGIVALLKGKESGKTIAVRADMDGLMIGEETNLPFKSENAGFMHACGHDIHMASVMGTVEILCNMREFINGSVKFIFQPAEEVGMGAKKLIDEGVLDNQKVDAIIGGHVWPGVEAGKIELMAGPIMAAPDAFEIVVKGRGGHGSQPHLTIDPIPIACQVVQGLQLLVSRINNPIKPLVISVGSIQGGTSYNIIPDNVVMKGTVRTLDDELRNMIPEQMERIIRGIVDIAGAEYSLNYEKKNPVTINHEGMTDLLKQAAIEVIGSDNVIQGQNPTMVGEDFSYYAQKIPSCFIKIGITKDKGTMHPLHSSNFVSHESAIRTAAAVFSQTALNYLNE